VAVTAPPDLATPARIARHPLDVLGRFLMILTSRRLDRERGSWLVGPSAQRDIVGHGWVQRLADELGGTTSVGPDHGLLTSFGALAGARFRPDDVDPRIADFYEHTTRWRLDLWSEWSAYAWPFGRLITASFSERLQQLSLPMRPLDVSYGMDSRVVHVHDASGAVAGAAWLRNMRKTGSTTYSGLYGPHLLPGRDQPSVRVVFPLPLGSVQVFLEPSADANGGLHLRSPLGRFGADGAYLVLKRRDGTLNARRIPIAEHFHLFVDDDGDVRADHALRLWNIPAVRSGVSSLIRIVEMWLRRSCPRAPRRRAISELRASGSTVDTYRGDARLRGGDAGREHRRRRGWRPVDARGARLPRRTPDEAAAFELRATRARSRSPRQNSASWPGAGSRRARELRVQVHGRGTTNSSSVCGGRPPVSAHSDGPRLMPCPASALFMRAN